MEANIYAYANLSSAGLGNLLFPWGRCEIFRSRHQIPMLAPRWTHAKIGPLLRWERDKRYYTGLFWRDGYIGGLKKKWLLMRCAKVREADGEALVAGAAKEKAPRSVVVFEGMEGMFNPLAGQRELLAGRIRAILRPAILKRVTPLASGPVIGVHIRHGDKYVVDTAQRKPANFLYRIPDDWFLTMIVNVRKALGSDVPVVVFTDARPGEIQGLEKLPNVTMAENNPSIVDILRLSLSSIMIGTSTSTFGMWSAYLGAMPSIWYPSEHEFSLTPESEGFQITGGLDGSLPQGCEELLRQAVK